MRGNIAMTRQPASKIVLLGTGTPNADPERSGPSVAIVVDQTPYLIDMGPGVVRRAAAAHLAGVAGLEASNLSRVFVTHLHSDHTVGYPDVIFTPWVLGREAPLEVFGPAGIKAMTEHILAAYEQDIEERTRGLEPANVTGYEVRVHEVGPGVVYRDQRVSVEAFRVNHGDWEAFGYKFYAPDRTIVVSGDTAPFDGQVEAYGTCDVLIHEVYSGVGLKQRRADWQTYHSSVHTSARELAELATSLQPKLLILYHQLFNDVTEHELVMEVKSRYTGRVVSGKDLEVF
jgi:ribonuclease BN (tRNA processing enzyme)